MSAADRPSPAGGELYLSVREALATIAGPSDSGPWITVYREAGGGYEGLQAIAREALALLDAVVPPRVGDGDAREAEAAEIYRAGYVDGGRDELDRQLAGGVQDTPAPLPGTGSGETR